MKRTTPSLAQWPNTQHDILAKMGDYTPSNVLYSDDRGAIEYAVLNIATNYPKVRFCVRCKDGSTFNTVTFTEAMTLLGVPV